MLELAVKNMLTAEQIADFEKWSDSIDQIHAIAQNQLLIVMERAADLGVDPFIGICALKYIADVQLEGNIERGTLTKERVDSMINMSKELSAESPVVKEMVYNPSFGLREAKHQE